jgi:hypothetical protein
MKLSNPFRIVATVHEGFHVSAIWKYTSNKQRERQRVRERESRDRETFQYNLPAEFPTLIKGYIRWKSLILRQSLAFCSNRPFGVIILIAGGLKGYSSDV